MARETKVGLLVGMGMILLIGIIISDHFSVAGHQNPADFTAFANQAQQSISPLASANDQPTAASAEAASTPKANVLHRMRPVPTPDEITPPVRRTVPQTQPASPSTVPPLPRAYRLARESQHDAHTLADILGAGTTQAPPLRSIASGEQVHAMARGSWSTTPLAQPPHQTTVQPPLHVATAPPASTTTQTPKTTNAHKDDAPSTAPIIHYVKAGESLYEIAQQYYGNGSYWRVIAAHNPDVVQKNGQVNQGVRLVIPNRAGLANTDGVKFAPVTPSQAKIASIAPTSSNKIEVHEGDTLIKLAAEHLGGANQWRRLFDANRDELKSPDDLQAGMTLVLPKTKAEAQRGGQVVEHKAQHAGAGDGPAHAGGHQYVVKSGDTLYRIAQRMLGDAGRWKDLYQANRDKLTSPDDVTVGQTLQLPG